MKKIVTALAIFAAIASQAIAAEIDFSAKIMDPVSGMQFTDCTKYKTPKPDQPVECEKTTDITLGYMAYKALNTQDASLTYSAITERGDLARRVLHGGRIDLSTEEITTIKNMLPKTPFFPVLVAQAIHALDSAPPKPMPTDKK